MRTIAIGLSVFTNRTNLTTQKNNHSNPIMQTIKRDTVSFGNMENLPEEIKRDLPWDKSIYDVVELSQRDENIRGRGANSIVYNMPYLYNHVLKNMKKEDGSGITVNSFPSDRNFGQPVWQNPYNSHQLILKKVPGEEHSIKNWSNTIWNPKIYRPEKVTETQAYTFLNKIQYIAALEQQAFDNLADDIKYLDDNGFKVDCINPNNLLVDKENRRMHIIDSFKVKPHERDIYKNCHLDIAAIILDFTLFPEYFDKLDTQGQKNLLQSAKIINEKVKESAINVNLSTNENRFKTFVRATSTYFTAHSVPKDSEDGVYFRYYDVRCEDFINMLHRLDKNN